MSSQIASRTIITNFYSAQFDLNSSNILNSESDLAKSVILKLFLCFSMNLDKNSPLVQTANGYKSAIKIANKQTTTLNFIFN